MKSEINSSSKWNNKSIKKTLIFPNLSINEENRIRRWANAHQYQCIIDQNEHKAIIRNPKNNKIAYIQKLKGDITFVFNNREESFVLLEAMAKINQVFSQSFTFKGQMKAFLDTLHYSHELSR